MKHNSYQQALDYLYSYVDYSLTRNLRYSADKFNLERMHKLLNLLDNPHSKYHIVHVGGTKGKGSTSAFISSILLQSDYQVGSYSSPHMQEFTERIRVNNQEISHTDVVRYVEILKPLVAQIPELTTFEITTALCFYYFACKKIDMAVIEVGLGGRLDATNVVQPIISVITSISRDHMNILGNTMEKIAIEKSGIIKRNTPVIVAKQRTEKIKNLLCDIAQQRNAMFQYVPNYFAAKVIEKNLEYQRFIIKCNEKKDFQKMISDYEIQISLLGSHQVQNALTAYCVINSLKRKGYQIRDEDILEGYRKTKWLGRFEVLNKSPSFIIDVAHNVHSVITLIQTLKMYLPGKKIIFLFGASEDKDIKGMLKVIARSAEEIILTQSNHPRAAHAQDLLKFIPTNHLKVNCITSIEEAAQYALNQWTTDTAIVATGSIFIVAAVRKLWFDSLKNI